MMGKESHSRRGKTKGLKHTKMPEVAISRLSIYSRCLAQIESCRIETISSQELAERAGINPAQMRKDLSYFGQFGRRGVGYETPGLKKKLMKILGLDREWRVAIVGAGNLGSALSAYRVFKEHRFIVSAVFDNDRAKRGNYCGGVRVSGMEEIKDKVFRLGIEIAIIAVPAESAQWVASQLIAAGLKAILNFAPTTLTVPDDVKLRNVDLSVELENLSYFLAINDQDG